jgi:hypothetical protein
MKVTGKAVMLDEIINYVQSLQRQVEVRMISSPSDITEFLLKEHTNSSEFEQNGLLSQQFLSMKLSTVNPRLELDVDSFIPEDVVSSLPLETGSVVDDLLVDCVVHFLTIIMYNAGQQAVCACDVLHGTATASSLRT